MSYIIEIPRGEMLLIAALLHTYAERQPESTLAQNAIQTLCQQTDCVTPNRNNHLLTDSNVKNFNNNNLYIPPENPYQGYVIVDDTEGTPEQMTLDIGGT